MSGTQYNPWFVFGSDQDRVVPREKVACFFVRWLPVEAVCAGLGGAGGDDADASVDAEGRELILFGGKVCICLLECISTSRRSFDLPTVACFRSMPYVGFNCGLAESFLPLDPLVIYNSISILLPKGRQGVGGHSF